MRRLLTLLAAAVTLLVPASSTASFQRPDPDDEPGGEVAIFYYAWFGTPAHNGDWLHWNQQGARPPHDLAATFYPVRGPYSSADGAVLDGHMAEIASAGVDTVVTSWWGRGSDTDALLPAVVDAASAHGLHVAAHVEPYPGRSAGSVATDLQYLAGYGIRDVYVYDSVAIADAEWATLDSAGAGIRLFANTALVGKARAGGFDGLYTYDVLLYDGRLFPRLCAQARRAGLLCAPSVGPGYDARNATPDRRVRPRRNGATYDGMWRGAISSGADVVTITSYNEWHEGTQIEAARPAGTRYASYGGAWGLTGKRAQTAYLDRTAYWAASYRSGRPPVRR